MICEMSTSMVLSMPLEDKKQSYFGIHSMSALAWPIFPDSSAAVAASLAFSDFNSFFCSAALYICSTIMICPISFLLLQTFFITRSWSSHILQHWLINNHWWNTSDGRNAGMWMRPRLRNLFLKCLGLVSSRTLWANWCLCHVADMK